MKLEGETALVTGGGTGIGAAITERFVSERASTPAEMAGVCVFLAGEDSSFLTGAVLGVDGGAVIVDVAGVSND